ncbi:MAG: putative polysaccharide biosynthesis protein [Caldicoprobacterales bacterium]|nr:polysaccharide biosynthesis protein [Clostridiales bacterium]
MKINTRSMLYGTMILSTANLIVRLLGFAYRVFLSRMIGPQGMGLVQLVFPVFQIAITLIAAGIPAAVSRLISEKNARQDILGMRRTMTAAITMAVILSTTLALLALLNLDFITRVIIKDQRTKGALFILFPNLIFIGLGAALKGFFYGRKEIHPPALAEMIEQFLRMSVTIGLIHWLVPKDNYTLAAVLVMLGTVFGEISSLLFLHTRYHKAKKHLRPQNTGFMRKRTRIRDISQAAGAIAAIAMPITATRLISSIMLAANSILIPQRLMAGGMMRDQALGLFGIVSGMVMPLLFLPFTITNALTVVIIPNLSESRAMNRWKDIQSKINKAIRLTCYIAFASTALLVSLGRPAADLLYQQPLAAVFLIPLSYSLLFHALQHTCSGILNGLGKQNRAALHFIAGSSIQLLCTWFLLANPLIRIWGMIIGFTLSSMIVSTANLTLVLKTAGMSFRILDWILKPGFAALFMGLFTGLLYQLLTAARTPALLNLPVSAAAGLLLFLLLLWAANGTPALEAWKSRFKG